MQVIWPGLVYMSRIKPSCELIRAVYVVDVVFKLLVAMGFGV